ncbi:MAG: hypothetical protein Q7R96_02035, partial [Nanoarchaeota archaeon]|nr:hypothetical protein [Nanoarchaeota archaeon]
LLTIVGNSARLVINGEELGYLRVTEKTINLDNKVRERDILAGQNRYDSSLVWNKEKQEIYISLGEEIKMLQQDTEVKSIMDYNKDLEKRTLEYGVITAVGTALMIVGLITYLADYGYEYECKQQKKVQ